MNTFRPWIKLTLVAVFSFLIGVLAFWAADKYLLSSAPEPEKQETTKVTKTKKTQPTKAVKSLTVGNFEPLIDVSATPKVLSMNKKRALKAYDPTTKKTTPLSVKAIGGSGTAHQGSSSPLPSPSNKLFAYINKKDSNLWVIDADGRNNIQISTQAKEADDLYFGASLMISGWSNDERFLVYHVNIEDESPMGPLKGIVKPNILEGFYAADIETGKVYFLPNLPNFVDIIPVSNKIVFNVEGEKRKDLYTYEITSGEVEQLTKEDMLKSWSHQFSFASNGKHYAYVEARTEPSHSKLIYTTIDNSNKQVIAQGSFADVQWPHISPNGKLIAFTKRTGDDTCLDGGSGCPKESLNIYDLKTKKTKKLREVVRILHWFDDSRMVVNGGSYEGPLTLELINIKTGKSIKISDNEASR
jgi:hypothetical protein